MPGDVNLNVLQSTNGTVANSCYCPRSVGDIVGGGVKKAEYGEDIIVITLCQQSPGYGQSQTLNSGYERGFTLDAHPIVNSHAPYTATSEWSTSEIEMAPSAFHAGWYMYDYITTSGVTSEGGSLSKFIIPRFGIPAGIPAGNVEGWDITGSMNNPVNNARLFLLNIVAAIDSGNQDDILAGGTGTLDGTWITNTAPGTPGGHPAIANLGHSQTTDPLIGGSYSSIGYNFGLELENPYWTNNITWGDWDVQQFMMGQPGYNAAWGWNGAPFQDIHSFDDQLCMYLQQDNFMIYPPGWGIPPFLTTCVTLASGKWNNGLGYHESPTGHWGGLDQQGWTYDPSFSATTSTDLQVILNDIVGTIATPLSTCISAETSGTNDFPFPSSATCLFTCYPVYYPTYYECTPNGCQPTATLTGNFINLSACTASCTSYTCTITGCTLGQGTGGTETLSACTGTCIHFECTELCGCVETPGYGNLSLDYVYSTLNQCKVGCIGYKCYNELGIQEDTKVYVYYDGTSMGLSKVQQAYWGLQSYLNSLPNWNGYQQHQMGISESWLGWSTGPYGPVAPWTGQINGPAGGNAFANSLPSNTAYYNTRALRWATGVEDWTGGNWAAGYPDLSHWTTFQNAPGVPPENFIGQPTLDGYTNNNANNPNGGIGQDIHLTYWGQKASPGDDVLVIVFADESHPNYYASSTFPSFYGTPRPIWKTHYSNYVGMWEWLEGGCSGSTIYSGQTREIPYRAFLYPTTSSGVNGKRANFALHGLAAISVGNLLNTGTTTPFNGLWSAGTAPRSTGVGNWDANNSMDSTGSPGYCPVNLDSLETANPYMSTINTTTSARFYSASTATTMSGISLNWGGLETMGWGINTRFPSYNVTTFSNDLTQFLSASTTQMTGVTCISAETLCGAGNLFPHCELSACTATCANYDCSPNGCIVNVSDGQYPTLAACTAACQSYTCTTTGCSVYNVPYVAANGIIDYATSYGSGGTYFNTTNSTPVGVLDAELSCVTNCQRFICDDFGCQGEPGIAGFGEYSSLPDCISGMY